MYSNYNLIYSYHCPSTYSGAGVPGMTELMDGMADIVNGGEAKNKVCRDFYSRSYLLIVEL